MTGDSPRVMAAARVPIKVRYNECDPMNLAHHSVYPVWMEIARTELLRASGVSYKQIEAAGVFIVVARLSIRYRRPAYYDDDLIVDIRLLECRGVKLEHQYTILRGEVLIAEAQTTLVCVDRQGKAIPVPDMLLNR